MKTRSHAIYKQKGAAALLVSVVLLIAVTLVVMFASRVALLEQRTSANEYRHKQAFSNAEAGLERAGAYLRRNSRLHDGNADDGWSDCPNQTTFPCNIHPNAQMALGQFSGGVFESSITDLVDELENTEAFLVRTNDSILAVGRGVSDDQSGQALAQVAYVKTSLITPGEIPPIMAPQLNLNGNFTIVANPNNGIGTTGVPISGWTETNTSGTGTWRTCHLGDFRHNNQICSDIYTSGDNWKDCSCVDDLSNKDNINYDIYVDPDGFPSPFQYIFGEGATVENIRPRFEADGKYYPANCAGLDTLDLSSLPKPWVWVKGDCNVPDIGSATLPVILVVEGRMTLNANTDAWGLLISLSEVRSNGSAVVHGSLVADGIADIANGGYKQVYNEDLLNFLADDSINTDIAKVKYSWRDF